MRTIAGAPTPDELELLERDLILGPTGQRYLERHHLSELVRYHHILDDDRQPDLHDHPWDFTSMLLTGGYRETTTAGTTEHWAPTVVVRDAEEPHRLELLDGPMWTLVATGPARRRWGFHTGDGWVHWSRYPDAGRYDRPLDDDNRAVTGHGRRPPATRGWR